jgi:hypothetical protein
MEFDTMRKALIENIACQCVKLVYRSRLNDLTAAALSEGITDGLLLQEAFDSADANELDAATKEMSTVIDSLEKRLANAGDGWVPVISALKDAAGGLDSKAIAQMALSGETKKLAKASTEFTKKLQSVAAETSAVLAAVDGIKKNLSNFEKDVGDKGDDTIAALSDSIDNFPDLAKLDKGVNAAYQIPKWFDSAWAEGSKAAESETEGGFFKKAMSFVGGMFKADKTGRLVDAKVLADAVKATSFTALMDLDVQGEVAALTQGAEAAGTESTELAAAGAGGAEAEGGGEESAGEADGIDVATDEEAEEEQDAAEEGLTAAAEEVVAEPESPGVAVANALDAWSASLSKSSQGALAANKRLDSLKTGVAASLEKAAEAVESEVAAAVQAWRAENEETLIKSKRFAKKNFDALEKVIPQIASVMLKKTTETKSRMTRGMVRKSVFNYLDGKFASQGVLYESSRWESLAGMRKK